MGACVSYVWQSLSHITEQLLAGHQSGSQWIHSYQASSAQLATRKPRLHAIGGPSKRQPMKSPSKVIAQTPKVIKLMYKNKIEEKINKPPPEYSTSMYPCNVEIHDSVYLYMTYICSYMHTLSMYACISTLYMHQQNNIYHQKSEILRRLLVHMKGSQPIIEGKSSISLGGRGLINAADVWITLKIDFAKSANFRVKAILLPLVHEVSKCICAPSWGWGMILW